MSIHKQVKVKHYHNEGERLRQIDEAAKLAEITKDPDDFYEAVIEHLKPLVIKIVERAFRRYCKKHGASVDLEELEWKRFKKILNGML